MTKQRIPQDVLAATQELEKQGFRWSNYFDLPNSNEPKTKRLVNRVKTFIVFGR